MTDRIKRREGLLSMSLMILTSRMLFLIWAVALVVAGYLYYSNLFSKFSRHGVKSEPALPVVGNMGSIALGLASATDEVQRIYRVFPEERFIGRFAFNLPQLMLRDIELVKQIAVKDFEYFVDRRTLIDEKIDPLFGRNLFSLKGQEWKDMRSTLSPAFTSSKMKTMLPLIVEVGDQMNQAINEGIDKSGVGYIDMDTRDLTTRYANDVIASCAFGLKVTSQTDRDNEFYIMGKSTFNFNWRFMIKIFGFLGFPIIMRFLKASLFGESAKQFFRGLVNFTMKDREERNIIRPDMIQLLMDAKKGKLLHEEKGTKDVDAGFATVEESSLGKKHINREWSQDDLVAQAILFFLAGFETVSTMMTFLLYELACNPEVQERLLQEIRENDAKNGGKFDYNSIQNMNYMDMVVSEAMRLWAPVPSLDRVCVKDYNIGKPNKTATQDYIIRKGEGVEIPVWGFHRDPEFFPEPEKFDPERFSEENKHKINPIAYMPFGVGPRNCIGSRFALCEVKVLVYQLLLNIEVSPCEKTCIPPKLAIGTFQMRMAGGEPLRMKRRTK